MTTSSQVNYSSENDIDSLMISALSNYSEWVEWGQNLSNATTAADHNNDTSNLESVVRNKDGSVRNPLVIDLYVFSINLFCCLFGLPLNFYMAVRIVSDFRLRNKPKNIFLLDMIICNIFTLFTASLEILNFFWLNETLCKVYVSIVGLSYIAFYFNLLLSLIDRFVAITRPFWHRRNITAKLVIVWLLVFNLSLAVAFKWIYVGGTVPLRCEIQISHGLTFQGILLVELVACIIFHIIDFVETRENLPRPSRTISVLPIRLNRMFQNREIREQETGAELPAHITGETITTGATPTRAATTTADTIVVAVNQRQSATLGIHLNSEGLDRLEKETTKTFLVGIIPILLLSLPWLGFAIFYHICIPLYGGAYCNNYTWMIPYFKALMTCHALVHPVANLCRNEELSSPTPLANQFERYYSQSQFS